MTPLFRKIGVDQKGASALEFALVVPMLTLMIYGIFVLGQLFEASAGMQSGLGEGARYATLCLNPTAAGCTVPTDAQITSKVSGALFGPAKGLSPTINRDTTAKTITISLTYSKTLDFLFFTGPNVSLTRSKVAYYAS